MLNETIQVIVNQVGPIFIGGVCAFLVKEIVPVGDAIINLLNKKKDAVANQIGIDKYNSNLAKAKNIWGLVDEEFRITPALTKTIESAQNLFEEKIVKAIPGITKDEIEQLRQTVAGEVNKGKAAIITPEDNTPKTLTAAVKYVAPDGTELQPVNTTPQQ